jgi:regulator of replication initiation timing
MEAADTADESCSMERQLAQNLRHSLYKRDCLRDRVLDFVEESSRLRREAHRLRDEAELLHATAECRQEEAERLSEESRQKLQETAELEKEYNEAHRMCVQLGFEALCLALRRNDPHTRGYDDKSPMPRGYSRPLGEALQRNTIMSSLYVRLDRLLDSDNPDVPPSEALAYMESLVRFVSTSTTALRCVKIDGWSGRSDGYVNLGGAFMEAVGVSSVEELTHQGRLPCHAFCTMMKATSSLKRLTLESLQEEGRSG